MNDKAEFAVEILREYANQNQTPVRSTSDLSPLEQWLILRLADTLDQGEQFMHSVGDCGVTKALKEDWGDIEGKGLDDKLEKW